jgi:hypothetical protein
MSAVALLEAFSTRPPVDAEFERCAGWLADALEHSDGTHNMADIRAGVANGHYHLWPGKHCASVTEVLQFPRRRVLNVFLSGGDLEEILIMERDFCSWGRYLGCDGIMMTGRDGWQRKLKNLGWRKQAIVLAKSLEVGSTT